MTPAERRREQQRQYRARDPVLKRIRDADYHAAHREARCAAMRDYYARNRARVQAAQARYRAKHRAEIAAKNRARYHRQRFVSGTSSIASQLTIRGMQ